MAFNFQTFKTRALTAIIFAAVMLTGLLWNQWSFFILFSVIHFGCWQEYITLIEKIHDTSFHRYMRLGFMLIGFSIMLLFCGDGYHINNYSLRNNFSFPVSVAGFVFLVLGIFQKNTFTLRSFGTVALGLLYISLSWGLMIDLSNIKFSITSSDFLYTHYKDVSPWISFERHEIEGSFFPIVIIACMWINDTMAYIVGSIIGKTPFSKISPKKTWEGTLGGIILCIVIVGLLINKFLFHDNSVIRYYHWYFIAAIAAIAGTFGDLFESKLKRMAGVKDSGHFMPGHGGFLDRFDSLLIATPFVWLYVKLIMV
jgi:phosphatidate cytidylyltransferase